MYGRSSSSSSSESGASLMGPGDDTILTMRAGLDCGVELCEDSGCEMRRRWTGVLGPAILGVLKTAVRVGRRGVSGAALVGIS